MAYDVSRETEQRLRIFAELVLRWTARISLISRGDRLHLWDRHIADSLQLCDLLPAGLDRAIDVGSGGGFPGLVLAIATGVHFDLIESDARKAAFLREAIRATAAPATVHVSRAEDCHLAPALIVTARAVAPLPVLLPLIQPLLAPEGRGLLPRGAGAVAELTAAAKQWHMDVRLVPSKIARGAIILDIAALRPAHQNT